MGRGDLWRARRAVRPSWDHTAGCKGPGRWHARCLSMWVDDSTAEAHARVRSAGKRARRGEQGLVAPVARDLGLL
eukprot:126064-Prymnesium_polylepis.1